jgi:hypothetical protein
LPFSDYIADFVCLSAKLVIELDGSQHAESKGDEVRDAYFAARGYRVLRIWNADILRDPWGTLDAICRILAVSQEPTTAFPSPLEGEGGFLRSAEIRVRGPALSHAQTRSDSAGPLIRPSGTFSLKGRREQALDAAKDKAQQ